MTYEKIVESVKKSLAKVNVGKANSIAIQVDIVGEGEGAFYVKVNDGTLAIEPYEYYDHDAKLIISGKDCVDLFNGKLDAEKAYKDGKIKVEGNLDSVLKLKNLIPAKPAAAKAAAPKAEVKAAEKPAAPKATAKKATETTAAKKTTAKEPATATVKKAAETTDAKNTTVKKAAETPAAKKTTAKKSVAKKPAAAKKTSTAKSTK